MKWLMSIAGKFMLTCEKANAFIIDYLEDRLEPKVRKKFEAHVAKCMNCNTFLDQYKTTVTLVKDADTLEIPEDLVRHTLAFLEQELEEFRSN